MAAAIFDLDGVVTITARVHAAAWRELFDDYLRSRERRLGEPFLPFTDADYRAYVDGRPRFDGVRTFLAARGITLPQGDPSDPSGAETITGLGNRKNALFHARLREKGVDVDEEAVRFIRALRSRGVRVGVASSSKNTQLVLETAGLEDLFDARVDGVVSERLGLRGKPAPDIFLECLEMLDAPDPTRAMVVEDAEAGVEAGRAGGFGLVLGVDRGGSALALREHGADWIIRDFKEVSSERIESYFANRTYVRPNAIAHWADIADELRGRPPAVFLDYDGTLTPIVARPELATTSREMRKALRRLATALPTTVVSGRAREDVAHLVGVEGIHYAGSHGLDIAGPAIGGRRLEVQPAREPFVTEAAEDDTGRTVLRLLEALGLDRPDVVPLYVGGDVTDEGAFRALEKRGIGVIVTEIPRPTAARYSLQDVDEVREMLNRLAGLEERSPP